MGLKTIPFRDIEHQAENMYEAVVAMSGQAKDHQESELDVFDELEETAIEDYEEKDKVTTVAIKKFLTGDVKWSKPY